MVWSTSHQEGSLEAALVEASRGAEGGGPKGERWTKNPVDSGGIAASSCAVADLNADGRPDIVCIGSATANLKWYENKGIKK